jgi:hypothetical protein
MDYSVEKGITLHMANLKTILVDCMTAKATLVWMYHLIKLALPVRTEYLPMRADL